VDCQGPPKLLKIAQDTVFCRSGCGWNFATEVQGLARHRPIDRRFKGDQTSTAWPKFLPRYQSRPKTGDLIRPGYNSNYGKRKKAAYIYLTGTLNAAIWGASSPLVRAPPESTWWRRLALFEDDPNLTDKKYPGNPTHSYRSKDPLRVIGEVLNWQGHPPKNSKP